MKDISNKETRMQIRMRTVIFKTLLILLPASCIVCFLLWRTYDLEREARLEKVVFEETSRLRLFNSNFELSLQNSIEDLFFLETLNLPRAILESPTPASRRELEELFIALAKRKGVYDQIRLLDATGMEIVRVNYNDGAPAAVPLNQLQDKSGRYYFADSLNLPLGEVYISPLDLNMEQGRVELPFKPMLRLGTPLFNTMGQKVGVLLFNVLAQNILSTLQTLESAHSSMMLMNSDGYWLKGPTPEDEWGFMFPGETTKQNKRFQNRFPQVWPQALEEHQTWQLTADGLFCTMYIHPSELWRWSSSRDEQSESRLSETSPEPELFWILGSFLPQKRLDALLPSPTSYLVLGGTLFLFLSLSAFFLALYHEKLSSAHARLKRSYGQLSVTEQKLRERKAFYRALFKNNLAMLMLVFPENGAIKEANAATARYYGYDLDALESLHLQDLDERDAAEVLQELAEAVSKESSRSFHTHMLRNGERREMELYIGPVLHDGSTLLFCIVHDVTEQRLAERALRESEELLRTISDAARDAIIMIGPKGKPLFWNPAATSMFGFSFEEISDKNLHTVLTAPTIRGDALRAVTHFLKTGQGTALGTTFEALAVDKEGREFPVAISLSGLRLPQGWGAVASVRDITERKEFERELHLLATTDTLTGCINRREFLHRSERELSRAKRHGLSLGLLMLDADHFKLVNDTYGHEAGDRVLQYIARTCLESLRSEDACGRLGGEEFAMLLPETDQKGALLAAERLRQDIAKSGVRFQEHDITITVSIGVALAFTNGDEIPALLQKADAALYRAKARGRNRVELA